MSAKRVLALVALAVAALITSLAQEGEFEPYRQRLPDGEVSWYEGWIRTRAEVPLVQGVARAQAVVDAKRVALMKAQAAALRLAMKVPVDSERRLEQFEALKVKVQGVVRGGKVLEEGLQGDRYVLVLEVPVTGVKGLAAEVFPVVVPELAAPPPPPPQAQAASPPAAPGAEPKPTPPPQAAAPPKPKSKGLSTFASVRVEAEEAGAKPALAPKIVDPSGQPVYTAASVNPEVSRSKSIARYVTRPAGGAENTSFSPWLGPTSLPLAVADPRRLLLAQQVPPPPPPPAPAPKMEEKSLAPDFRFGDDVLVVKAVSAKGKLKADLVVTEQDAKRLRDNASLLENAEVTVVVRTDVGGVESRRLNPDPDRMLGRR